MLKYRGRSVCFKITRMCGWAILPLVAILFLVGEAQAGFNNWSSVGPVGKVHSLAVASGGSLVYAGGNGSIYKSTNGGAGWGLSLAGPFVEGGIAFHPTDSQIAYAASHEGVYKTADGGASWNVTSGPTQAQGVAVDPASPTNVYAAGTTGIFRSTDSGLNWNNISAGLPTTDISAVTVVSNTIYVGTFGNGVWKSPTGAISWTDISFEAPFNTADVKLLAVDPTLPSTIYAAVGSSIYKTTDGGATPWTASFPFVTDSPKILVADPNDPGTVYAGVVGGSNPGIFKSTDSGDTWSLAAMGGANGNCSAIGIRPDNSNEVYYGTDNGVKKTSDGFVTYPPPLVNTGLSLPTIRSFAEGSLLYAGGGEGIWDSVDGYTWTLKPLSMPSFAKVSTLSVLPGTLTDIFAGIVQYGSFQTFQSTNVTAPLWIGANNRTGGGTGTEVTGIVRDATNTFMAVFGDGIYTWDSGNTTWNLAANANLTNKNITGLALSSSGKLFSSTQASGLFISADNGSTWTTPTTPPTDPNVFSIAVAKSDPNILIAGSASSVFRSSDAGLTWSAGGAGPTNVTAIVFHSTEPSVAIAGTKTGGVFYTYDAGATWQPFSAGLPSYGTGFPAVNAVSFGSLSPNLVHIGLEGGGVYHRSLKSQEFAVTPATGSFGSVSVGFGKTITFTISNNGELPLVVNNIFISASPFTISTSAVTPCPTSTPFTLTPAASCNLDVTFATGSVGTFSNPLEIISNDPASPHNINLNATGVNPCAWTNAAGGNWNVAANWTNCGGNVPTPTDDVDITLAGNYTVTLDVNATVKGLHLGNGTDTQTLSIPTGSTLSLNSASSVVTGAILDLSGGTLTGSGALNISGALNWTSGAMTGSGTTNILTGATATLSSGNPKTIDGRMVVSIGTVNLTTASTLFIQNGGSINNNGTFDVQSDSTIDFSGTAGAFFNNSGAVFKKTGASGVTNIGVPFLNTGMVDVQSGTVSLNNGGTHGTSSIFKAGAGAVLAFGGGTHAVNSGTINAVGTILFSGGATTIAGGVSYSVSGTTSVINGTVNLNCPGVTVNFSETGGTFTGTGSMNVSSSFDWSGGTIGSLGSAGSIDINSTATASLSGTNPKILDTWLISHNGIATMTGTGSLQFSNGGKISNQGTFDLQSDAGFNLGSGSGTFTNNGGGVLKKSVATGVSMITPVFNNSGGTVDVQSGTVSLNGDGTHSGTFGVAAAGNLVFGGGTHAVNTGSINVLGGIHFGGATTTIAPAVTYTASGSTNVTSGTVNFNNTAFTAMLNVSGGTLSGTGTLGVSSNFGWSGGAIGSPGSGGFLNLNATSTASVSSGAGKFLDTWVITNSGTVTMNSTVPIQFANSGGFTNNGLFDLQTDAGFSVISGSATFTNSGAFRKSVATGLSSIAPTFNNSGTMDIQSGKVSISGTPTLTSGTSFTIGGTTPGTQHGQLMTDSATLGGSLTVTLNTYNPNVGDSFTILTCGTSCAGTFATPSFPPLTGRSWTPVYSTNSVVLNVVDLTAPTDVGILTATPGTGLVALSWPAATDTGGSGVASYIVASSTSALPVDCTGGTNVGSGTSYPATGLTNGILNYFRVCAVDNSGNVSTGLTATATPVAIIVPTSATVSGAITYTGTNRAYISLEGTSLGTSVSGSGTYTISGVPPNPSSFLFAFVDNHGTGTPHLSDPIYTKPNVDTSAGNAIVPITFTVPVAAAPLTPAWIEVNPTSGAAIVRWDTPHDTTMKQVEVADKYTVYWSTTPNPGPGNTDGWSKTVAAINDGHLVLTGLADNSIYYFTVTATYGTQESAPAKVFGPVLIANTAGGTMVSGTVNFSGIAATGPLYIVLEDYKKTIYVTSISVSSLVSPNAFTIYGVPDGTYRLHAFIDQNNNNVIDFGDPRTAGPAETIVTVSGAAVSGANLTIPSTSALASVTTRHMKFNGSDAGYMLNFSVEENIKRPVAVTLSGTNVIGTIEIGRSDGNDFYSWLFLPPGTVPTTSDTYTFNVTYSDNSSETLTAKVTGVLNDFAAPVSPAFDATVTDQLNFSWNAPTTNYPYVYQVAMSSNGAYWNYDSVLSPSRTSVPYNFDRRAPSTISNGSGYVWSIMVRDYLGNTASYETPFTLAITTSPTVTSYSPAQGDANVPLNSAVTVTFSREMDQSTITGASLILSGGVTGKVNYDPFTRKATLRPDTPLSPGATYTATLTTAAKDITGNAIAAPVSWSFTTGTTVQVSTDANGNTTVPVNVSVPGVTIFIPAGTTLSDSAGPVGGGTLNMTSSLLPTMSALPQAANRGHDASGYSLLQLGSSLDVVLSTGSATVKTINPPMVVNMAIPPTFAAPGTLVNYYSFDGTGWVLESKKGPVPVKADGTVDMLVGHLSLWGVAIFNKLPTGKIASDGNPAVTIADALRALQIAVGIFSPTSSDLAEGDVAPLVNGRPQLTRKGNITVGDAIVLIQKALGLVGW